MVRHRQILAAVPIEVADRDRDRPWPGCVVPLGLEAAVASVHESRDRVHAKGAVRDCHVRSPVAIEFADRDRHGAASGWVLDIGPEPSVTLAE